MGCWVAVRRKIWKVRGPGVSKLTRDPPSRSVTYHFWWFQHVSTSLEFTKNGADTMWNVPRHCRDAWQTFHDAGWEECRLVMELDGISTQSPVMFECSKRIQKEIIHQWQLLPYKVESPECCNLTVLLCQSPESVATTRDVSALAVKWRPICIFVLQPATVSYQRSRISEAIWVLRSLLVCVLPFGKLT